MDSMVESKEEKKEEKLEKEIKKEEKQERKYGILLYVVLAVSIVAIIMSAVAILMPRSTTAAPSTTTGKALLGFNINSNLITPPTSLADAPVITQNESFGHRLTNINEPFNSTELAVINNAPDSYFEQAGEMLLNGSIKNEVFPRGNRVPMLVVNGKPSVIYLGSITCLFCSENKWAMALALSRFGNFSELFKGYSSFGDGDLPTIYFAPARYNSSGTDSLGNFYSSKYINFISIEDENPITAGFALNPMPVIAENINASGNLAYKDAFALINELGSNQSTAFQGTPYTIWGAYQVGGADAVDLGNSMPKNQTFPLTYMTHAQVLSQLAHPDDQFAYTEYAAADVYVAMVCSSINNTAPVCSLPAIKELETII